MPAGAFRLAIFVFAPEKEAGLCYIVAYMIIVCIFAVR